MYSIFQQVKERRKILENRKGEKAQSLAEKNHVIDRLSS